MPGVREFYSSVLFTVITFCFGCIMWPRILSVLVKYWVLFCLPNNVLQFLKQIMLPNIFPWVIPNNVNHVYCCTCCLEAETVYCVCVVCIALFWVYIIRKATLLITPSIFPLALRTTLHILVCERLHYASSRCAMNLNKVSSSGQTAVAEGEPRLFLQFASLCENPGVFLGILGNTK